MAATLPGVFAEDLRKKILHGKILVVGAGGIGCEILKNLVLSGFADIEIIDLDTIEVSNLNRQFLFHKEHVGKSKSKVARESALRFNPNVNIEAHHDSITTINYGVSFFQRFNLVLNALDNRQARNHVNRMCLTADIPLIESGTAGYNGQVELIKRELTQCYECTPKSGQKSFPGCTIRNTPSELIHCIVWSKHLFNQLFGETNEDEDVSPDTADPEASGEAGTDALAAELNEKGNIERVNTRQWAKNCRFDSEKLFNKLFYDDIKYLLSMSNLWKSRTPPDPIKWGEFTELDSLNETSVNTSVLPHHRIWSIAECAKVFAESITALKNKLNVLPEGDNLIWDKDDKFAMDFVASCANIRANIFHIAQKSRFDIKAMAGNIIPAIATTNAITAGIVVMHAFKVLQGQLDKCTSVYMRLRPNARNQLIVPEKALNPPNPKCYVCSPEPKIVLKVDTKKITLKEFRDDILIKSLSMVEPDVLIDGKGIIVLSSEEGETDMNNDKLLADLNIVDGTILKVDDFFQKYWLAITVFHIDAEREQPLFEVVADPEKLKPQKDTEVSNSKSGKNDAENENDVEMEDGPVASTSNGQPATKPRLDVSSDEEDCYIDESFDPEAAISSASTSVSASAKKRRPIGDGSDVDENSGQGPSSAKRVKVTINNDDDDDDDDDDEDDDSVNLVNDVDDEDDCKNKNNVKTDESVVISLDDDDDLIVLDDD